MKSRRRVQYTIRDVPPGVDALVRETAKRWGRSMNKTLVALLSQEAEKAGKATYDDLNGFFGSWVPDEEVDRALAEQRRVDSALWK